MPKKIELTQDQQRSAAIENGSVLRQISSEQHVRAARFDRENIDEEARTVPLAFSSEEPYMRWFGLEILDHAKSAIRLNRLKDGGAVLVGHDHSDHVGVVEEVRVDADRRGRAVVRFGKSARASEIFDDIKDGIRSLVSVGYLVHKAVLEETSDEGADTYRITDWEPYEISMVSVPADATVGVGRSVEHIAGSQNEKNQTSIEVKIMPEATDQEKNAPDTAAIERSAGQKERTRVTEILAIADKFDCRDMAGEFITTEKSVLEFREAVLDKKYKDVAEKRVDPVNIQFNERENKEYSIVRAMAASLAGDWGKAGFEREISGEIAKQLGRSTEGFFIPTSLRMAQQRSGAHMQRAPMVAGTDAVGGYAVDTEMQSMIELLRNRMMVRALGATVLGGLQGDLSFPRQATSNTLSWVGENPGSDVSESNATLDQVLMAPKTAQSTTAYSRQLLAQGSIDVEAFVRNDLIAIGALGLDKAAIKGGGSNEPTGILATTGIGDVAGGTNGLAPTWAHIVGLETEVAIDNADIGNLAYLTTAQARGKLKTTEKASSTGQFVWNDAAEAGYGNLNGYRAAASGQVPANGTKGTGTNLSSIIFGNWADLLIGEWGAMEIILDPYAKKKQALIEVTSVMMADVAVRHPQSFAAMQDAITA